ncbi:MAG: DNA-binding response regulator, partial [Acidobacteria bacterium]|nr:DNA-binding response regulator [Acidobacteriota bacterium]
MVPVPHGPAPVVRLFLICKFPMYRAVLRQWLAGESRIEVVGEADPSDQAADLPPNAADVFLVEQVGGSRGQCGCVADLLSCQPEACAVLLTDVH